MIEVSPELVQILGLFCGLGALYGGIRSDLKRLHEQSVVTMRMARSAKRRINSHLDMVGLRCPHSEREGMGLKEIKWNRRRTDQAG